MPGTPTRRHVAYPQLLHLLKFLKKHREVAVGLNKSTRDRERSKRTWQRIAFQLNSLGEGPVKSGSEWSKYWVDYKARIKRKNRLLNEASRTGSGPPTDLELSEIDRKFLSILDKDNLGLPDREVDPVVKEEHLDSDRPGTPHSTITDEEAVYLEEDFLENENQEEERLYSISQTPSHLEQDSQSNSSSSASRPASVSHQQWTSLSARLAKQRTNTSQEANTHQAPRKRQRKRRHLTAADARAQLVAAAQSRAQAELANSHSLKQAVGILGDMVSILRRIEAK